MAIEKIYVTDTEKLEEFYDDWSLTFTGIIEEEAGLYLDFLRQFTDVKDRCYIVKGKLMNEYYNLHGDNRYDDDLTFLVIKSEDIAEVAKIALPRFQIGGRWFTDIVDNNASREA